MLFRKFSLLRIKLAAFIVAGCASCLMARAQGLSNAVSSSAMPGSSNRVANPIFNAGSSYVLDDKHVLGPADVVSFQILEDRDPAIQLLVADSGELEVPYIGRISVENKTCKQLARELKGLLEKEYYYQATVIVGLNLVNKVRGKVYVWGQVQKQGPVDLLFDQKLTAGKAILMAGGFGDFANKKKVRIVRGAKSGVGDAQSFEVNMVDVLENNKTDRDMVLEPDDFIIVLARAVNF
ncbi:MAG: polysaccharide biosynthesis/export family protein [Limisphaerales bacterium]